MAGHLLSDWLLQEMQTARTLGGPIPGRPWTSPAYGLGLMQGGVVEGLTSCALTGAGPGSVVAIYRFAYGIDTASCAIFCEGSDEGSVEAEVLKRLSATLKSEIHDG